MEVVNVGRRKYSLFVVIAAAQLYEYMPNRNRTPDVRGQYTNKHAARR